MRAALDDLIAVLADIPGLVVNNAAAGAAGFTLSVGHGPLATVYHFGAKKLSQQLTLTLTSKGPQNQPATVYEMNKAISDALILDRRRNGNAQTTIVGTWETTDDNGREGLEQTLTVEVQAYEN